MVTRWHLLQREALYPGLYSHSLHVRRGSSTSDNLNQLSGNDSLSGTVEENLVLVDHLTSVLGSVLRELSVLVNVVKSSIILTSIAFRRADCSQAWPSARAQ